ncbi:hypothetical protein PS726_06521 [Pseudomonas fluorescens]|nr:hypothetical protein PS726_06521 [Pseudomonas fluorescens]
MSEVLAQRIVSNELRFDIEARQAELVDGEYGNLFFAQLIEQRHGYEGVTCLLHRLVELRAIFSGQVQEIDYLVQLFVYIGSTFAGDGQVVAGTVVSEEYAVAVIDQPAGRCNRQDMYAIVFGDGRVIVELDYLQEIHAHQQRTGDSGNEQAASHQPFIDQACLFLVVLDGYRLRHLCSNSLKRMPIRGRKLSPLKMSCTLAKARSQVYVIFFTIDLERASL